jgi:alpha-L-rhamnosidase
MLSYMEYMSRQAIDYICDYGLADWCSPINKPQLPAMVTDTAYYYHNTVLMGKMAELIGEPSDKWIELAKEIRKAWRAKFLDSGEYSSFQTFYACAIYQGMLDEDEIPVCAKKLAQLIIDNDNHIDCGILGTKYIFTALSENGYMDLLYKMIINPTWPSYAYWINKGYKTLCESWDIHDSCNHHMFGEVDNWFYKYIGGLDFNGGNLTIKPYRVSEIDEVEVTHKDVKINIKGQTLQVTASRDAKVIWNEKEYNISAGNYTFE